MYLAVLLTIKLHRSRAFASSLRPVPSTIAPFLPWPLIWKRPKDAMLRNQGVCELLCTYLSQQNPLDVDRFITQPLQR